MPHPVPAVAISEPVPPTLPLEVIPPMMEPPTPPVPSMPEPTPPGVSQNVVKPGTRISVPALGPIGTALDFKLDREGSALSTIMNARLGGDHRQLFNFSIGVFGSQ